MNNILADLEKAVIKPAAKKGVIKPAEKKSLEIVQKPFIENEEKIVE